MDLFLIKVGKAWNAIKRDGVMRGSKRVARAFLGLFRGVEPGDILFVSNGVGDSARYRTVNVAEELNYQGIKTAVTVQDNPFLVSYAHDFSVFVFHRVLYTPKVRKFIEHIKEHKGTIIFETDDLVYDPVFLKHMDYYSKMNSLERKLYEHGVGGEILADPYVQTCTTTTPYLAERLKERGKRVLVVRNKLSLADVTLADKILSERSLSIIPHPSSSTTIRLCYLSGTPSHNKDFATITAALGSLLAQYKNVRLVLAGPLDIENKLSIFASQIERVPFLPRDEYFAKVATMDINLAPLEIGNPFCESKSELKFFEAGLVAVPTVAAGTETFKEAIEDGVDGFVANTVEEWRNKIEKLILDPELRTRMGKQARQTALMRYTTKVPDREYVNFLKEKIV